MGGLARILTTPASTKRRPAMSGGKIGAMTTSVASLLVAPLAPVDADLQQRLALDTPHELLQTVCDGSYDVAEGDVLVVGSVEYPVRACEDWGAVRGRSFRRLVVEQLKT